MSFLVFPEGLNVRTRVMLPIVVATLVGTVGTSFAYTTAYREISDDALPELALVNKVAVGTVSLRGEYGEFALNPTPETREEIDELKAELDSTLAVMESGVGLHPLEAPFVKRVRLASDDMRSQGDLLFLLVTRRQDLEAALEAFEDSLAVMIANPRGTASLEMVTLHLISETREFFAGYGDEAKAETEEGLRVFAEAVPRAVALSEFPQFLHALPTVVDAALELGDLFYDTLDDLEVADGELADALEELREVISKEAQSSLDLSFFLVVAFLSASAIGVVAVTWYVGTALERVMTERQRTERLTTLGQLTASVSHELRNPLGTIRTSMFTIRKRAKEEGLEVERAFDRVERSLVRCDSIVDDLQEFTRGMEVGRQPTNLDRWLEEVLASQPVPTGIDVIRDLGTGVEISLDQEKMTGVINNLMENAVQAIQSEQKIDDSSAAEGRIEVSAWKDDSRVMISVTDTGPGFPRANLDMVFEPLFTTKTRGIGLGLAIVRKIAVLHGGVVTAENGRDGGAVVTVELPLPTS